MNFRQSMGLSALAALFLAAGAQAEGQTNAAKPAAAHDAQARAGMPAAKSDRRVVDPRPEDPTANLPSDSGAHTELPSGAVTGAGLAHGTIPQPDLGMPGGLEERARAEARAEAMRDGWSAIDKKASPAEPQRSSPQQTPKAGR